MNERGLDMATLQIWSSSVWQMKQKDQEILKVSTDDEHYETTSSWGLTERENQLVKNYMEILNILLLKEILRLMGRASGCRLTNVLVPDYFGLQYPPKSKALQSGIHAGSC